MSVRFVLSEEEKPKVTEHVASLVIEDEGAIVSLKIGEWYICSVSKDGLRLYGGLDERGLEIPTGEYGRIVVRP